MLYPTELQGHGGARGIIRSGVGLFKPKAQTSAPGEPRRLIQQI